MELHGDPCGMRSSLTYLILVPKKVNGIQIPVREIHIVTDISIQFPCDRSIAESGKITHKMGVCMGSEKGPTK